MEQLPYEIIIKIALDISLSTLTALCQTSKRSNDLLSRNEYFWYLRFHSNYKAILFKPPSWKELYKSWLNLYVCGRNHKGTLGLDSKIRQISTLTLIEDIKPKSVINCDTSTMIIDMYNNIWVTGANTSGQLGLNYSNYHRFTQVPEVQIKQLAHNKDITIAIDLDNNVWVCGYNLYGSIDLKTNTINLSNCLEKFSYIDIIGFTKLADIKAAYVTCNDTSVAIIMMDNTVLIQKLGIRGLSQVVVPNVKAKIVCLYLNFILLITTDSKVLYGTLKNFITGEYITFPNIQGKDIAIGRKFLAIIDIDDNASLYLDPSQYNGDISTLTPKPIQIPFKVRKISVSRCCRNTINMAIIDEHYNLWVLGNNTYGQLGLGDTNDRISFTLLPRLRCHDVCIEFSMTIIGIKL